MRMPDMEGVYQFEPFVFVASRVGRSLSNSAFEVDIVTYPTAAFDISVQAQADAEIRYPFGTLCAFVGRLQHPCHIPNDDRVKRVCLTVPAESIFTVKVEMEE
jgi:hypothetical protein